MGNPRGKITGKKLGVKGLAAVAQLQEGYSLRKVHEITGISETTASALRKRNLVNPAQVEAIRKQLRDRFAMVAHDALAAVDHEKLKAAGVGELVRAAAVASDRGGISPPSVIEHYYASIAEYVIHTNTTPALDVTPSPGKPANSSS